MAPVEKLKALKPLLKDAVNSMSKDIVFNEPTSYFTDLVEDICRPLGIDSPVQIRHLKDAMIRYVMQRLEPNVLCAGLYNTVGIQTHRYAPELNRLVVRDNVGNYHEFNVPAITDLGEAERYAIKTYNISIVGNASQPA